MIERLDQLIARKRRSTGEDKDALARLVHAVDDDGARFTDDELLAESMTLFFAGHETMAKTMSWTMFLLERHPALLAEVLDEIDGVLGGRSVTAADIVRLPLLDRVIEESTRVLSSVPLLFLRVPADDLPLGSITLPKGANVVVSPYATHRDPALYPRPRRFEPERRVGLEPSIYEYLPFGAGPRLCIGATFARQALRLMIATVLQRVRVSIVRGANISRLTRANIMRPRHGLPAHIQGPHRRRLRPEPIRGDIHELVELSV